jgi:hypothetical protein
VEFPPSSFDSSHVAIEPWNDSFDEKKQRIKVDNVVTVEGQGVAKNGDKDPTPLKFRCGYVGSQMLAFGWNDPVPPLRPHAEPGSSSGKKGKHGAKTKSSKKAVAGTKTKSSGKSTKKASKKH